MQWMLYRTTCLVTGKIYYGVHGTNNIDDGYLGSGKFLLLAIKKYGKENFVRQIVHIFEERDIAYALEKEVVDQKFILRRDVYNCNFGGKGGGFPMTKEARRRASRKTRNTFAKKMEDVEFRKLTRQNFIERMARGKEGKPLYWKGKKHKLSTRRKQSRVAKIRAKGIGNNSYGTHWICHHVLKLNKRIKKAELNDWVQKGWIKGRKVSYKPYKKNSGD